jgi:hypothetical protein
MNRYESIKQSTTSDGITYRNNAIYPEIPLSPEDYYVITTIGDRYDKLALQFYSDSSLWWIIAAANNSQQGSLQIDPGIQLRIPYDKAVALDLFRQVNKTR